MEVRVVLVCCALWFLGLLSASLGFAAEATMFMGHTTDTGCIYPKDPTIVLGVNAGLSLCTAFILIFLQSLEKVVEQCNPWILMHLCFTFCPAAHMFLYGSIDIITGKCVVPGFFAAASVLSLVGIVLVTIEYLIMNKVLE
ncbi:hypothetical protein CASFOL_004227 [Castilleja foliolosa]|uniref:Uncharacterized protein n=1 Tax=Castilleja foliolosa TaxID=1961234 RepID=A0ABD3E9S9_9LAMI